MQIIRATSNFLWVAFDVSCIHSWNFIKLDNQNILQDHSHDLEERDMKRSTLNWWAFKQSPLSIKAYINFNMCTTFHNGKHMEQHAQILAVETTRFQICEGVIWFWGLYRSWALPMTEKAWIGTMVEFQMAWGFEFNKHNLHKTLFRNPIMATALSGFTFLIWKGSWNRTFTSILTCKHA